MVFGINKNHVHILFACTTFVFAFVSAGKLKLLHFRINLTASVFSYLTTSD